MHGNSCTFPTISILLFLGAARQGHAEVVDLLLENGANVTAQDNFLWTPLVSELYIIITGTHFLRNSHRSSTKLTFTFPTYPRL
jgi:Ankyrin repeat